MALNYAPAQLDSQELAQIENLERDLGRILLAVEPIPPFATLTEQEIAELQETEKNLGCVVLAYQANR